MTEASNTNVFKREERENAHERGARQLREWQGPNNEFRVAVCLRNYYETGDAEDFPRKWLKHSTQL